MEKIGYLGLGIMGKGMASRLAELGHEVVVWNRTRQVAEEMGEGVVIAENPRQAAEGCDIVFTMLADPAAVNHVVFGANGLLEGLKPGAVYIDCSTVDPETSRKLGAAAKNKGADFLDAPVGGSKDAAATGQLTMMIGGDEAVLEKVRPVLEKLSRKITYAGGTGHGAGLKLCFNLMVSHMAAALAESFILAAKGGIDPQLILDALNASVLASKFLDWKGTCMLDHDFVTNFSIKLMHKDVNLMMQTAYNLNVPLPVTASVKELFGMAKSSGDPEADFSSVIRVLEELTNTEVKRQS